MQGGRKEKMRRKSVSTVIGLSLIFFQACDLDEFKEIEEVSVVTHARYILPLAYGTM